MFLHNEKLTTIQGIYGTQLEPNHVVNFMSKSQSSNSQFYDYVFALHNTYWFPILRTIFPT